MSDFSSILALDTTMGAIGVGVHAPASGVSAGEVRETLRGQAELLVPMVQDLLAAQGTGFADIDALVTPLGPGTFTGLRIGLAAAKSFAMALDIPLYGISTLQVLALQYVADHGSGDRNIMVLIETKRSDFYCQIFDPQGQAVSKAGCYELDDLKGIYDGQVLIGDAVDRFGRSEMDERYRLIDPVVFGKAFGRAAGSVYGCGGTSLFARGGCEFPETGAETVGLMLWCDFLNATDATKCYGFTVLDAAGVIIKYIFCWLFLNFYL